MTDYKVRVENLKPVEGLTYVACSELLLAGHVDKDTLEIDIVNDLLEINFLEVEDDVGHIFHHPFDCVELMQNAVDADRRYCKAFERRKQDTAKGVADCDAVAGLQGFELKLAEGVVGLEHDDLVGFLEC